MGGVAIVEEVFEASAWGRAHSSIQVIILCITNVPKNMHVSSLCICIEYCALNKLNVKNKYSI